MAELYQFLLVFTIPSLVPSSRPVEIHYVKDVKIQARAASLVAIADLNVVPNEMHKADYVKLQKRSAFPFPVVDPQYEDPVELNNTEVIASRNSSSTSQIKLHNTEVIANRNSRSTSHIELHNTELYANKNSDSTSQIELHNTETNASRNNDFTSQIEYHNYETNASRNSDSTLQIRMSNGTKMSTGDNKINVTLSASDQRTMKEWAKLCEEDSSGSVLIVCPTPALLNKIPEECQKKPRVRVRIAGVSGELDLAPLRHFTVTELIINDNNLTTITNYTQILTKVTKLDLSNNPNLDASFLPKLGPLPELTELRLQGSPLHTPGRGDLLKSFVQQMPKLERVDVSFCEIRTLASDTFSNTTLTHLNLAGNDLFRITLDQGLVRQLIYLNLSRCNLEELRVKVEESTSTSTTSSYHHPTHRQLQVKEQEAASSTKTSLVTSRLKCLDLSGNHLKDIPGSLINIISSNNATINIKDNSWNESCNDCSLYPLWNYAASNKGLVMGREDLDCFKLSGITRCGWQHCPNNCKCDEKAKIVDCQDAGLTTIPVIGPLKAETLLLQRNKLSNLRGITSPLWCRLRSVVAASNLITTIVSPQDKGSCSCEDDEFYAEEPNCFPRRLHHLDLSLNYITNISLSDCRILYPVHNLNLSGNRMESMGARSCGSLQQLKTLYLQYNHLSNITEFDFATFPNLLKLNLSHNVLTTLQLGITRFMPMLRVLDVSHNGLVEFRGKVIAGTPFSPNVMSPLEELRLDNNNFSEILSIIDLKDINTLKKLTLNNNSWFCNCANITEFPGRVLPKLLQTNVALGKALRTMECDMPQAQRGNLLYLYATNITKVCPGNVGVDQLAWSLVGFTLMAFIFIFIGYHVWPRRGSSLFTAGDEGDSTAGRKYDVFVCHAYKDYELVKREIICPLTQLGYSVAWHDNAFKPGDYVFVSVEKAISNSRRMIVVASENLNNSRWVSYEIRRGRHEECDVAGFKITALVLGTLPRIMKSRDLFEIVAIRTHILYGNSDVYLKKLREFLPAPCGGSVNDSYTPDHVDHLALLLERMRKRNPYLNQQQAPPISEIFSIHLDNSRHIAVSVDISNADAITPEECEKVVQRFKQAPSSDPFRQPHTISTEYQLEINGNDEEEFAQFEGFEQFIKARRSCRW